jgi:hypothetical protein
MAKRSISLPDDLDDTIEGELGESLSGWLQRAARIRLEIERAAEAAAVDTGNLPEGWWQDYLYEATREHLRERRERELADEEEREGIEAD